MAPSAAVAVALLHSMLFLGSVQLGLATTRLRAQHKWNGLTASAPCSPTAAQMANVKVSWNVQPPRGHAIKYFLHQFEGLVDFPRLKDCYLRSVGATDDKHLDDFASPVDAEHSTDFRLVDLLREHPARVDSPDDAELHVMGLEMNTMYLAPDSCHQNYTMESLQHAITQAMAGMKYFQNSSDRFMFIDTDWRVGRAFGDVIKTASERGSILLGADAQIAQTFAYNMTRVIPIPYKTHYKLESRARLAQAVSTFSPAAMPVAGADGQFDTVGTADTEQVVKQLLETRHRERPIPLIAMDGFQLLMEEDKQEGDDDDRDIPIIFNGNLDRRADGRNRSILLNLTSGITGCSVESVNFKDFEDFAPKARKTAQAMLQSTFCLVPDGDTPSSRRLFDALAAGCVPIVFADIAYIGPNLPFRNTIEWSEIAIFAGSLDCSVSSLGEMQTWIKGLLSEDASTVLAIEAMRQRGLEAYTEYLSYESSGMVGALLNEFGDGGAFPT